MSESRLQAKRESALATVAEARAAMLACVAPLAAEDVLLEQALGRVLASAIAATRDQPPFAASQMDGYALRVSDTPGRLKLVGEAAAGRSFAGSVGAGEAVRISTGAAVPEGADAVVMQEDIKREAIVTEIRAVIEAKSKTAGYSLVIDIAAESVNKTPVILFSNGENDITETILSQINAVAPGTKAETSVAPESNKADAKPAEKKK